MRQPSAGLGGLEEKVQEIVAPLRRGKDGVAQFADSVSDLCQGLSSELAQVEKKARGAAGAEAEALGAQAAAYRSWLDRLTGVAQTGAAIAGDMDASVDLVADKMRELACQYESAQQSRNLGLHVIKAQEEERRRLAREIHDGPAQLLNSVVLRINVCQKLFDTDPQRLYEELNQLKDLVRLSLQDVRKIIFDLRPMALDDLGLIPALRAFLKDYQARTGIEADFAVFGNERRYESAWEVAIFRLVQEALSNVYKHAGASRVWVKVDTAGGREIRASVKDDGAGFEPEKVLASSAGTKFGLVGMRERCELLGGSMEVSSSPGQGTKLGFVFPLGE